MTSSYVIRMKENRLLSFYYNSMENQIMSRAYVNNHWSKPDLIADEAMQDFTVRADEQGQLYLFCRDYSGNVILCHHNGTGWQKRTVFQDNKRIVSPVLFYPFPINDKMYLIYNLPDEEGTNQILYQRMENGKWETAQVVDHCQHLPSAPFSIVPVTENLLLIFYRNDHRFGYKEILLKAGQTSDFYPIHTSSYQISDQSVIISEDTLHVLYIVKSQFSSQLIYKYKKGDAFSAPLILWEGMQLDHCSLFIADGQLWATWMTAYGLYYATSENMGRNFAKGARYRGKMDSPIMKASYMNKCESETGHLASDIYVDKENPWEVALIPDIYPEFYPQHIIRKPESRVPIEAASIQPAERERDARNGEKSSSQWSDFKRQLDEKDFQISRLTELIQTRNDELLKMQKEFRSRMQELKKENESVRKELSELLQKQGALFYQKPIKEQAQSSASEDADMPEGDDREPNIGTDSEEKVITDD